MIRSKSDFLERDIEKLTLLIRRLFEKVIKSPLDIADVQEALVYNGISLTLEDLLKNTLADFERKTSILPVAPKEFF